LSKFKKPFRAANGDELTAKKALGQHFLHDEAVCQKIVDSIVYKDHLQLVEIGPGPGAITKYLVQQPNINFACIELDHEKVKFLQQTYPKLNVIHEDFLTSKPPFQDQFSIIGNFPYNISTQIIFKVLEWQDKVPEVVGMFQKEVAQRFAAKHGNKTYGITSVMAQCYYDITYLFEVSPTAFNPPPKVQSAVIKLVRNNNPHQINNYKKFKTFIKAAFSQRRKTLRNALKSLLPVAELNNGIFDKRAEQLSVAEFAQLYKSLFEDE
jgi:16S rRNA (adenine1518-N6/adenine1519-N6)-dimethyltransferase